MARLITDPVVRFWSHVIVPDDRTLCWEWQRSLRNGYGQFNDGSRIPVAAHRYAYVLLRGPVPDGLVLDHLCRNRKCVNPDHLEPVTIAENVRRSDILGRPFGGQNANYQTVCPRGHARSEHTSYRPMPRIRKRDGTPYIYTRRVCLACKRELKRRDHEVNADA